MNQTNFGAGEYTEETEESNRQIHRKEIPWDEEISQYSPDRPEENETVYTKCWKKEAANQE